MAKLTLPAFKLKWQTRFRDNDNFEIGEADLREFALDAADTFGLADALWNYRGAFIVPTAPATIVVARGDVFTSGRGLWQSLEAGSVSTAPAAGTQWRQLLELGYQDGGVFVPDTNQVVKKDWVYTYGRQRWRSNRDMVANAAPAAGNWTLVLDATPGNTFDELFLVGDTEAATRAARIAQDGVGNIFLRSTLFGYGFQYYPGDYEVKADGELAINGRQGVRLPRLTQAEREAILLPRPPGLLVYQTDGAQPGYYELTASGWQPLGGGAPSPADALTQDEVDTLLATGEVAAAAYEIAAGYIQYFGADGQVTTYTDLATALTAPHRYQNGIVQVRQSEPALSRDALNPPYRSLYGNNNLLFLQNHTLQLSLSASGISINGGGSGRIIGGGYGANKNYLRNGHLEQAILAPGAGNTIVLENMLPLTYGQMRIEGPGTVELVGSTDITGWQIDPQTTIVDKRGGTPGDLSNYDTRAEAAAKYGVATRGTAELTFTQDAEYAQVNTTFTVDAVGARVGAVVRIRLGAGASEPTLPSSGFLKLTSATFTSGKAHIYSFCVAADGIIEYYIIVLP
ncbi:hypothetical protein MUN82_06420 [Hymenobacter aerilatus]|uniref:Uncharacterized protein n=1 Tax=Hymenobacter aerilatus TaxID=2932251 RepID=A0A8T9T481_9BACT|nr:hypothetical protein [Hymenobacter aerilatus]UOR06729.1 hypothetical protein MUN82_06420 [Hymenobacter aerilatus]